MLRDVQHEARLAHRGTGRDEHQIRRLQPGCQLVEIDEAGRDARDQTLVLLQLLDRGETALDEIAQRREPRADPILGDLEDRLFRIVEDQVGVVLGLIRGREDAVRGVNQVAESGLLLDDAGVVLDVCRARHAVGERRDVGRPADLLQLPCARQLLLERDQIDRVAALAQVHHLVEDAAVRVAEEVARVDQLGGVVERVVVDEDRAENGFLGFEIVRKRAIGRGDVGHGRGGGGLVTFVNW